MKRAANHEPNPDGALRKAQLGPGSTEGDCDEMGEPTGLQVIHRTAR